MIELKVEDYCQNCSNFDPEVSTFSYYADCQRERTDTIVKCKYAEQCRNMFEYIKNEVKG